MATSEPRKLIDWFDKNTGIWKGECNKCGETLTHRGTEPTQTRCTKPNCGGDIVWRLEKF